MSPLNDEFEENFVTNYQFDDYVPINDEIVDDLKKEYGLYVTRQWR